MHKRCFFAFLFLFLLIGVQSQNLPQLKETFKNPADQYKPLCLWYWLSGEVTKSGITKDLEAMKTAGLRGAILFDLGGHISDAGKNLLFSEEWNTLFKHTLKEAERLHLDIGLHNSPGWSGSGGTWVDVENSMKTTVHFLKEIQGGTAVDIILEKPKHYKSFYKDIAVYAIKGHHLKTLSEQEISGAGKGEDWAKLISDSSKKLSAINTKDIIDLTNHFNNDQLVWNAPKGEWTVLRIGFTSTGTKNRTARRVFGSGLEPDKFDAKAITKAFYDGVSGNAIALEKASGSTVIKDIFMDSWEIGYQNWSEVLPEAFKKRRGYSMQKYLPVLAGFVVESPEISRRFLWDCRLTFGELIVDVYAKTMRNLSNKYDKKFMVEPYRTGGFHSFDYGEETDVVVSEFWKGGHNFERIKSVASIAHAKGVKEHRSETFTTNYFNGGWRDHPWQYKQIGDKAFCSGVNSMAFHSYAHQPYPDNIAPGMSMGRWGAMISRKQTWWPMAPAYMQYLSRCQYLLRTGDFVADVLFVTHEHLPNPDIKTYPELKKAGYDYDIISPSFFIKNAVVKNEKVVLPGGTAYKLVVFPDTQFVTPEFMKSIDKIVRKGVQTIGYNYKKSPSLVNYPDADNLVKSYNDKLIVDSENGTLLNYYLAKRPLEVLKRLSVKKDFEVKNAIPADAEINFIHHKISDNDVYFVSNSTPKRVRGNFRFRVAKGKPSLWNPVNGETQELLVFTQNDGVTSIQLELEPKQSFFVVFDMNTVQSTRFKSITSNRSVQESTKPKLELEKVVRGKIFNPDPKHNQNITEELKTQQNGNSLSVEKIPGEGKLVIAHYKINNEMQYYMRWAKEGLHLDAGNAEAIALGVKIEINDSKPELHANTSGKFTIEEESGDEINVIVPDYKNELELTSPWQVTFEQGKGLEKTSIVLDTLMNLSKHTNFNVKHYSGIITYKSNFNVSKKFLKKNRGIDLVLEHIANIATVEVNGIDCGTVWAKPYAVNIAKALQKGENKIVIKVANSWSNRLIGDEYFPTELEENAEGATIGSIPNWVREGKIENRPQKKRVAFTSNRFYTKEDPLPASGLFGKVLLKKWVAKKIK